MGRLIKAYNVSEGQQILATLFFKELVVADGYGADSESANCLHFDLAVGRQRTKVISAAT